MARRRFRRSGRERILPGHGKIRSILAALGLTAIVVGIAFFVQASEIDRNAPAFFEDSRGHMDASDRAMGKRATGGFLVVGGLGLLAFALQGVFARYAAAEHAPVVKDTVGYVVDGTRDSVKTVAKAVAEGIREGDAKETVVRCHKCNKENDADARFCSACGSSLGKTTKCAACGELNDPDANYCDGCGARM